MILFSDSRLVFFLFTNIKRYEDILNTQSKYVGTGFFFFARHLHSIMRGHRLRRHPWSVLRSQGPTWLDTWIFEVIFLKLRAFSMLKSATLQWTLTVCSCLTGLHFPKGTISYLFRAGTKKRPKRRPSPTILLGHFCTSTFISVYCTHLQSLDVTSKFALSQTWARSWSLGQELFRIGGPLPEMLDLKQESSCVWLHCISVAHSFRL